MRFYKTKDWIHSVQIKQPQSFNILSENDFCISIGCFWGSSGHWLFYFYFLSNSPGFFMKILNISVSVSFVILSKWLSLHWTGTLGLYKKKKNRVTFQSLTFPHCLYHDVLSQNNKEPTGHLLISQGINVKMKWSSWYREAGAY